MAPPIRLTSGCNRSPRGESQKQGKGIGFAGWACRTAPCSKSEGRPGPTGAAGERRSNWEERGWLVSEVWQAVLSHRKQAACKIMGLGKQGTSIGRNNTESPGASSVFRCSPLAPSPVPSSGVRPWLLVLRPLLFPRPLHGELHRKRSSSLTMFCWFFRFSNSRSRSPTADQVAPQRTK